MTATKLRVEVSPGAGPFDVQGDYYLSIPGDGNAQTPDHASLDITGDIDVRCEATIDWSPAASEAPLVNKYVQTGDQRSWRFFTNSSGLLVLNWSTAGTSVTVLGAVSTIPVTPPANGRLAVRATLDVDNGAGGHTVTFYTAPSITGTWTQLGAPVTTAGTTSIFSGSAVVEVGHLTNTASFANGRVHAVEIRNGIAGSVVANPNFAGQAPGTTSFADGAGRTWSVVAPAVIAGFDWVDFTGRLIDTAAWLYGRPDELSQFEPGEATVMLKNEDRHLDPEYTAGPYFGKLNPRVPVRLLSISSALDLPGTSAATASTPDHASLGITGDIDIRAQLAADDWTPGGFGKVIASQFGSAGNQAWWFGIAATGELVLTFTADGSTGLTRTSTVATGFVDATDHWVRATLDVNNGAGGHTVTFWTSVDGVAWTQLGAPVTTAGTVTIFNSTANLVVGDIATGGLFLAGQVRNVEVRNGIDGTIVTNPEFTTLDPGTTTFVDRSGRTWTVNGTAAIAHDTAHRTDEFYGFVKGGWVQSYRPPKSSACHLQLEDMQGVLAGTPLPQTAYEQVVLDDHPVAYWRLDETAGVEAADSSGNGNRARYDNGEHVDPLIFGDGHGFDAPHVGDNRVEYRGQALPVAAPVSLEAWVKLRRDLAAGHMIIVVQRDSALGSLLSVRVDTAAGGSPNGEVVVSFGNLGGGYKFRGHTRVDDDVAHHVVMTMASTAQADIKLYVDGVEQTKTTISGTTGGSWAGHLWWTLANTTNTGGGDFGLGGVIDEAAVYDTALPAERVLEHYRAGVDAFENETTGARIDRVLDIVGIPEALRDIAAGDTTLGPAAYGGRSTANYIAAVAESEQGTFHVDHRHGGRLKFRGRYARLTEPRSVASLATFTDLDGPGSLHYERDGLEVDPNAIDAVVGQVDVDWRGGTVQVASEAQWGGQSRSIRTEAPTPTAARSAGEWIINRYGQPQARVRGLQLRPDAMRRLRRAARGLELSDRVTVERRPQQVGATAVNELHIERISHEAGPGVRLRTGLRFSNADLGDVWIWGVSAWGTTKVWG